MTTAPPDTQQTFLLVTVNPPGRPAETLRANVTHLDFATTPFSELVDDVVYRLCDAWRAVFATEAHPCHSGLNLAAYEGLCEQAVRFVRGKTKARRPWERGR